MSMKRLNEDDFKQSFGVLQAYFGFTLKADVIKFYWQRLSKLSRQQFGMALTNIRDNYRPTSQNPFPLIADFLEACNQTGKNRAQKALQDVQIAIRRVGAYESVNFKDKALHATIVRFGGWSQICQWTQKEWNINEGRFLDAYKAALMNHDSGPEHLLGVFEAENSIGGHEICSPVSVVDFSENVIDSVNKSQIDYDG